MMIRKAVLPAAGLGTRFLPATKAQPKEMLPLVDKPLIQYVVEESVEAGISDVVIVTGRGKTAIEDHFDVSFELERFLEDKHKSEELAIVRSISDLVNVSYVRQKEALGLGHAVLVSEPIVGDQPFAVLLGDDLVAGDVPCIAQMIEVFERVKAPVLAVMRVRPEEISSYGVIAATPEGERLHRVSGLVEKPRKHEAPSDLAIIGRYILTPSIFQHIRETERDQRGEIQLTNALQSLLSETPVYGFEFEGVRHDCGNKLGFLTATVEYALRRPDLGNAFRTYLKGLKL
ncbi:MAG TPA: UTP--glucose-1-phosphate uridylyltransferase GalU [Vicinamibacteria bacterium]|nr:UTP--glucose-1-phosphate uridylyltransferase GalU [Vicinamibacteria bacterium]